MAESIRILLGAAPDGDDSQSIRLDLGPVHPSRPGHLRIDLETDGGIITAARVIPGAMHRGVEKLFEVRDYRQVLSLADRHDWQAPFFGELAAGLAVELALGIEVPRRAELLRTLLSEHFRMHSHLGFLSWIWHGLAPDAARSVELWRLRERLRLQTQDLTGNRVHPMVNRIGGLAADAGTGWLAAEKELAGTIAGLANPLLDALQSAPEAVAILDEQAISSYGLTGPAARAAGRDWDLRRGALAYDQLGVDVRVTRNAGDAKARLEVMALELPGSAAVIANCVEVLLGSPGPIAVDLPKILRVGEGEVLVEVEAPLGVAGVFLVARGEKTPWRLKLRTPSFANAAALEAALPGTSLEHLELAVASIGYVTGDLDK